MKDFFASLTKLAGFKLQPGFFVLLFIGVIIGFGLDYYFDNDDLRFRVFIYGASIIVIFAFFFVFAAIIVRIISRYRTRKAVKKLSSEDRAFVLRCYSGNEYTQISFSSGAAFQNKWKYVLYVPTGSPIDLLESYKIFVDDYAMKLIKKQMNRKSR